MTSYQTNPWEALVDDFVDRLVPPRHGVDERNVIPLHDGCPQCGAPKSLVIAGKFSRESACTQCGHVWP